MSNEVNIKLELIIKECFWGDYSISGEEAMQKLNNRDENFEILIISHILANSSFPSRDLAAIFSIERLRYLFQKIKVSGRVEKRENLTEAVLFNSKLHGKVSWIRM